MLSLQALKRASTILLVVLLLASASCLPRPGTAPPTPSSPVATTTSSTATPPGTTTAVSGNLTVYFLDVGQGDSILVDLGETEVLIDAGVRASGAADYIAPYVDGPLEVMVATHPDADHIGGLIEVLTRYHVTDIWTSGKATTTATYRDFMAGVNSEGATIHEAQRGDWITTGALTFRVLNPGRPLPSDTNNCSVVLWLQYGDVDFLFEGDAEQEAEAAMLASPVVPVPDCDILKVGHHGSRTASSAQYLSVTRPEVAIYQAGAGNTYGHPHQETIAALQSIGATVFGTEGSGTIAVTTNATGCMVTVGK